MWNIILRSKLALLLSHRSHQTKWRRIKLKIEKKWKSYTRDNLRPSAHESLPHMPDFQRGTWWMGIIYLTNIYVIDACLFSSDSIRNKWEAFTIRLELRSFKPSRGLTSVLQRFTVEVIVTSAQCQAAQRHALRMSSKRIRVTVKDSRDRAQLSTIRSTFCFVSFAKRHKQPETLRLSGVIWHSLNRKYTKQ